MERKRKNLAVTTDGATYNKRQRPDDFNALRSQPPPPSQRQPRLSPRYDYDDPEHDDGEDEYEEENYEEEPQQQPEARGSAKKHQEYQRQYGRSNQRPRTNVTYGQVSAIPGLDDGDFDDGDLEEGMEDGMDAMRYLRMVRAEASGIPHLMVAPRAEEDSVDLDDTGFDDTRGYYSDGAYVAAPMLGPILPSGFQTGAQDEREDVNAVAGLKPIEPQTAYNTILLRHYSRQHVILHSTPPSAAITALTPAHISTFPRKAAAIRAATVDWLYTFANRPPVPAQLALMDNEVILKLLPLVQKLLKRGQNIDSVVSVWIWALLGRLGEVGVLNSDEVNVVRELGKRAIWVACGFIGGEIAEITEPFGIDADAEQEEEATLSSRDQGSKRKKGKMNEKETAETVLTDASTAGPTPADTTTASELSTEQQLAAAKDRLLASLHFTDTPGIEKNTPDPVAVDHELAAAKARILANLGLSTESAAELKPVLSKMEAFAHSDAEIRAYLVEEGFLSGTQALGTQTQPKSQSRSGLSHEGEGVEMEWERTGADIAGDDGAAEVEAQILLEAGVAEAASRSMSEEMADVEGKLGAAGTDAPSTAEPAAVENVSTGGLEEVDEELPNANTRATLDMIIAVAGELYGQRDLLEFREIWK